MTAPVRRPDARGDARAGGPSDPGSDQAPLGERLALRNWSLPVKLAAVLLVPTLFVVTLGVLRIVEQTEKARSYDGVQQAVALEGDSARLLASLDGERRAAAVFLATNRAGGFGPVQERVDDTNDTFARLRSTYESANSVDDQTRSSYRDVASAIGQLDRVRSDVQGGGVDPAGAVSRYTDATSAVLTFDESLTREAADPSIAGLSNGLFALSEIREQDAYVQAVVASAIAGGRIDAPSIDQARNATLRRSIAVDEFRSAVGTDNAALADAVVGPDVDARDRLAQVVLGRGSAGLPLQVSPQDWDAASNAVQQQVTTVSDQLRGRLQANAAALQNGARNAAGVASVVLLLALMAGAAVVFFVTRSLLRPLRLLRRTALDVAERRLPAAVRSLREGETPDTEVSRTPIETREEIGEVARAFDQVHGQAVRLAAEQAGLRTAFNSIFVNLSRRSQALVERQLRLIEQLENKEEDPEALAELFQLDHLATRMRRNSENLLVLSGTDLARRGGRPVPLVDVLRAAASEVEQYQRVELAPPPSVQLLGRTAGDVVHLVAELLENAAAFSAPETRVDVVARPEQDGTVILEISDRGVGMTDQDLLEANQRLASPPTVDVSASRRMGLFVVGRLASRHAIAVSLRTRDGGGVVAAVRIPSSAVLSGGPGGRAGGTQSTRALGGTGLPVRAPGQSPVGQPAVNGAARPETAGAPIPRQEPREGAGPREGGGELPRRPAARGGAAAAGAAGAAGAAAFFAPSVDPESGEAAPESPTESAPAPGDGQEAGRRNGLGGSLASALPRRPMRSGPAPAFDEDPAAGPPDAGSGPPGHPLAEGPDDAEPDDGEADDDDRVASVVGDDAAESVTVWSQTAGDEAAEPSEEADAGAPGPWQPAGPPPGPVPTRAVAAHAWRGPDGEPDVEEDGEAETGEALPAGPGGRHGLPAHEPGQPGQPEPGQPEPGHPAAGQPVQPGQPAPGPAGPDGRPAPRPRPGAVPSEGWRRPEQGPPPPGRRPGPPSHPGMPSRPGYPGAPHQGRRPGPWSRPGEEGSEQPAAADPGPRAPGTSPAPTPPMWNGAEVVPPPGPTTGATPADAPDAEGTDAAESAVHPGAAEAGDGREVLSAEHAPDGTAPGEVAAADVVGEPAAEGVAPTDAAPAQEEPAPRPATRMPLRPLSQRRQPEGGPLLRPGSAPRLRPRPLQEDGDAAAAPDEPAAPPPATGEELFAASDESGAAAAPAPQAPGRPAAPAAGGPGGGRNGAGHTNGHGSALPGRTTPEAVPRRPAAVLPNRERTPIFDEVASVWFREPEPNDPSGVDPEWANAGRGGFDAGAPSLAAVDAGTTESGLPRRRPRAHLVPGSARPSPSPAPPPDAGEPGPTAAAGALGVPRRSAEAVRGRLASYQRGVADGRSTRPAQRPDGEPAGEFPSGPAHRAAPRTEEEEP